MFSKKPNLFGYSNAKISTVHDMFKSEFQRGLKDLFKNVSIFNYNIQRSETRCVVIKLLLKNKRFKGGGERDWYDMCFRRKKVFAPIY